MQVKFSKFGLPSQGVAVLTVTEENIKSVEIAKFVKKAGDKFSKASLGKTALVPSPEGSKLDFVILLGLGHEKDLTEANMQSVGATLYSYIVSLAIKDFALVVSDLSKKSPLATENAVANIIFGLKLRSYKFDKYLGKKDDEKTNPKYKLTSIEVKSDKADKSKKILADLDILSESIFLTRDMVSEPANVMNSEAIAKECKKLEKLGVKVEILGEKEMQKLGMNCLLAVGQASTNESKLVIMTWNGSGKKNKKPIAFVGKGVTFDSGGLSLKPAGAMETMKMDMAGAATVVGLIKTLATRKAKTNAIGVIGLVENMVAGNAQRPGDIVYSMSGQTVEVLNTDAEGRLVLADALWYTKEKFKPEFMINLATLTGAIVVALGDVYAGLFSNDDDLSEKIYNSSKNTGEYVWRFPLDKEFDKMINSDIADMKNIGLAGQAGSITAAQFLKRFVGDTKWAHLDIAGVAKITRNVGIFSKGSTGFGIRLLNDLVAKHYED